MVRQEQKTDCSEPFDSLNVFCFSCFLVVLTWGTDCNCCLRGIDIRVGGAVCRSSGIILEEKKCSVCFHSAYGKKNPADTHLCEPDIRVCSVMCSRAPQLPRHTLGEDNYVLVRERLQSYTSLKPQHGDQILVIQSDS